MHPMHPTIKAYIIAAQAAKPAAERARLAAAASRPRRETGAREGQRTRGMRHTCQEPDTRREQDTRGELKARRVSRRLRVLGRARRAAQC